MHLCIEKCLALSAQCFNTYEISIVSLSNNGTTMTTFTQEQYNFAHLVMYVGKNGPRVLKKYLVDNLFRYQLLKNEVHLLENLDPSKFSLIFPANEPVSSLDKLDDAVVLDVSKLVFNTEDINDTQALRRCLYAELEKPILCTFMQNNEAKFRKKNKRCKLLSRKQMDILFPRGDSINIDKLDITAVCFILFEGFNFMKPITDLDKFPADSDISPGSDILRIKLCRNRLAHNPDDEIGDGDFDTLWEYMTTAFGRLTGDVNYRQEGDRLKCVRPHMDIMDRLQSILEKWHKEDREERSDHLENITEKVACFKEHTENVIRDSTKCIISAVKKYAKHKPHKALFPWHQVCIKDMKKFKEVCERECIEYKFPGDYSTDNSCSSPSDTSPCNSCCDNSPRHASNTSYTNFDTRSFKEARAKTTIHEFDHHNGVNRVPIVPTVETSIYNNITATGYNPATGSSKGEEYNCTFVQKVLQPQLTKASKSRQRRGYDFNKQDEAELSRFLYEDQKVLQQQLTEASKNRQRRECDFNEQEVPYVGTSVYTGTNSISTGYYTATGSSAYGNTERGENNSAFHFGDGESETPGASDCGYASSVYTACPGRGKTYSQHVHYPFVKSSENRDIDTYGFPSSSHYDSHTLCTTPTELDTGDTYTCIGAVHRTQDRNTLTHFWRNVLRPVMCLKCITSQNKEEECPQPMMNTSSRNQAGLRRARQKQNQQDETNHGSPSEINTDYITLKLEDPYAVYSIA